MRFSFDKPTCQNIRKSLRKEWIETNGLGDYASSSMIHCNTRRYHGLFVTGGGWPDKRSVLLSALEESVVAGGKELFFSCHKYPGRYYPHGYEYLYGMEVGTHPFFKYHFGDITLYKEIMMVRGLPLLLIRYEMDSSAQDLPPVTLRLKPLLAFRHFHALIRENDRIRPEPTACPSGVCVRPYPDMPPLYMRVEGDFTLHPERCWYYNVEYLVEQERGFPYQEDLFQPGFFEIAVRPGKAVYLAVSAEEFGSLCGALSVEEVWEEEVKRRRELKATESIHGHLAREGERFIIRQADGRAVILAGYHWFNVWGRDMMIALPGLTFHAGRGKIGAEILSEMSSLVKNGLIPNYFASGGEHAYNSVDSSLWYIWAVQQMSLHKRSSGKMLQKECWPVIKEIISAYGEGRVPYVSCDEDGFLHVGNENTQLTWMDASVNGRPVTARYGCPVEICALWYNALAFADELARLFQEPEWEKTALLSAMKDEFHRRFWVNTRIGGYLADVWRENSVDRSMRPNQLFAVSMPYPILHGDYHASVVDAVRRHLLTPYGLRTLHPGAKEYRPVYFGGPGERDKAYHQGTVWPWLLGAYTEALLRSTKNAGSAVKELLSTLRPLFAQHLGDAGIGSISEIFDGDPPHLPNGAIAQAWSVAECFRSLQLMREAAPKVYEEWEAGARKGGQ